MMTVYPSLYIAPFYTGFILSVHHSVLIRFLFNILTMKRRNETQFCIHISIDKVYIGIVKCHFLQIYKRVMALD